MSKAPDIHSKLSGTSVYHDNNKCTERNNIEAKNIQPGRGGKKLCNHCKRLNQERK